MSHRATVFLEESAMPLTRRSLFLSPGGLDAGAWMIQERGLWKQCTPHAYITSNHINTKNKEEMLKKVKKKRTKLGIRIKNLLLLNDYISKEFWRIQNLQNQEEKKRRSPVIVNFVISTLSSSLEVFWSAPEYHELLLPHDSRENRKECLPANMAVELAVPRLQIRHSKDSGQIK